MGRESETTGWLWSVVWAVVSELKPADPFDLQQKKIYHFSTERKSISFTKLLSHYQE